MDRNSVRIHFIANSATGDNLDTLRSMEWDQGTVACTRHTWVWAVYCQLKARSWNVSLGYGLEPDAVNVVHGQTARRLFNGRDFHTHFIVGIRADFRPFPYGRFEIVQNREAEGGRKIFMPLYPQPGLVPRDPARQGVENVCVSGRLQNSIGLEELRGALEAMGCKLVFKGEGHWQEMSDVDVLLGIRTFSKELHRTKPATKMLNAWLAGIPFIGGYDSAYSQTGTPGRDYLRVASFEELLEAVWRLASDPELYGQLVGNGQRKVQDYLPERITDQWGDFFEQQVFPEYEAWSEGQSRGRLHSRFMGWAFEFRERCIARMLVAFGRRGRQK